MEGEREWMIVSRPPSNSTAELKRQFKNPAPTVFKK